MKKILEKSLKLCIIKLKKKSVIAYPTESVFGLGCDPDSELAVNSLLKLKKRSVKKGFILIAANYNQLIPYLAEEKISIKKKKIMFSYWPGHTSFVIPASYIAPKWLTGSFNSIAVRVSNHIGVKKLCLKFGKPLISTSANICGFSPCKTIEEVKIQFGKNFPILEGKTDNRSNPSEIRDILTGKLIRRG